MQEEKTWKLPSGVQAEVVQEALRADAMGRPAPTAHGRKSSPPEVHRSRKTLPERPGHHNRDPDRPAVSTTPRDPKNLGDDTGTTALQPNHQCQGI